MRTPKIIGMLFVLLAITAHIGAQTETPDLATGKIAIDSPVSIENPHHSSMTLLHEMDKRAATRRSLEAQLSTPAPAANAVQGAVHPLAISEIRSVWQPSIAMIPYWASHGINCFIQYDANCNPAQFVAAANAAKVYQIRSIVGDANTDAKNPYLLAWLQQGGGEIDLYQVPPATLATTRAAYPQKPWAGVFSGGYVVGKQSNPWTQNSANYPAACAQCDIIISDWYAIAGWNDPTTLDYPGLVIDKLATYAPNVPQIGCWETCCQQLSWLPASQRGPWSYEMEHEFAAIVGRDAGVCAFTESFGTTFSFDNRTPAEAYTMRRLFLRP